MFTFPHLGMMGGAPALPSFVDAATAQTDTGTTVTPTMPAGVQAGDLILVIAGNTSGSGAVTVSSVGSGYTEQINNDKTTSVWAAFSMWSKTAVGSDADPVVTFSLGTNWMAAIIMIYRNVTTVDYTAPAKHLQNFATTYNSQNWTDDEGIGLWVPFINRGGIANIDITAEPTTMTKRAEIDGASGPTSRPDVILGCYDLVMANRGTISRNITYNNSDNAYHGFGCEIR